MDIFQRRTSFGGGFSMLTAKIIFAGFKTGLAFSNIGVGYNQQIVRLWDLDGASGNTYLIAGHAMGQASIGKTIGPRPTTNAFYQRYGDVCQASQNTLSLSASTACTAGTQGATQFGGSLSIGLSGVVANGITLSADAQDPVIRQSMALTFIALDWDEQTSASQAAQSTIAASASAA
jgi:hypothetical protein